MTAFEGKVIDSKAIRMLIWTYFLLLIVEGVLRKWLLPSLSDPLLLVRDPFLVAIYLIALSRGIFPLNGHTVLLLLLGGAAVATGITVGSKNPLVTAYGFDSLFLHLPLLYIIPRVMTRDHVIHIGRYTLLLALPMAGLMVIQFKSHPDAMINCGAGGGIGSQLGGALGKVRPPGFFTFITGASQFLAFATAFVIYGFWQKKTYHRLLLLASGIALAVSAVVSTSRLTLGGIGVVFLMVGIVVYYDRRTVSNVVGMLIPIGVVMVVATNLDVFNEGKMVFEARLKETGDLVGGVAGTAVNWTMRVFGDFYGGLAAIKTAPLLGAGLGVGTNVGARLLTGELGFLLAEGEWARVVLELGPFLAIPYLLIRASICKYIYTCAAQSARIGNALPMLLFGSCGLLMFSGQFSQTSTLGFAVIGAGLSLAATNDFGSDQKSARTGGSNLDGDHPLPVKPRGCSAYAAMLHPK
jgi:hypothetical protein